MNTGGTGAYIVVELRVTRLMETGVYSFCSNSSYYYAIVCIARSSSSSKSSDGTATVRYKYMMMVVVMAAAKRTLGFTPPYIYMYKIEFRRWRSFACARVHFGVRARVLMRPDGVVSYVRTCIALRLQRASVSTFHDDDRWRI